MQKPLCKLCATRHSSWEPHNFPATDEAPDDEVAEKRRIDTKPTVVIDVAKPDLISSRQGADIRQALLTGKVLTIAERSRRYREKHGDVVRERNRLRMARIRAGPESPEE